MKKEELMNDSTGDGMAGAEDVSLLTQQQLKQTYYNGDGTCDTCGIRTNPIETAYRTMCPKCARRNASTLFKNRMS